jgi:hypothetical protein
MKRVTVVRQFMTRNQRLKCICGGYHFPHRRGGGACVDSKTRAIHMAIRGGDPDEIAEARLEYAMQHGVVVTAGCPF